MVFCGGENMPESVQTIVILFAEEVKKVLGKDIDISVIVKNTEHFNYCLGALPFYDNVEREGMVIHG